MKNLSQHRALATTLISKYGYAGLIAFPDNLTGESCIKVNNSNEASELYDIFGPDGYSFFYTI